MSSKAAVCRSSSACTSSASSSSESSSLVEDFLLGLKQKCDVAESEWCSVVDVPIVVQYLTMCLEDGITDADSLEDAVDTLLAYVPFADQLPRFDLNQMIQSLASEMRQNNQSCQIIENTNNSTEKQLPEISMNPDELGDVSRNKERSRKNSNRQNGPELGEPDEDIKRSIVDRHLMIADTQSHAVPAALVSRPTPTQKNNLRYLDGQVVSTKGGRFMEPKRDDSEEMKKTCINLKPLRKYRFH